MRHIGAALLILNACAPTGDAQDAATTDAQSAATADAQSAATIDAQDATTVEAHDKVRGLISLPQVFGTEPCETFTPIDVTLYANTDSSAVIGRISVERPWTISPSGGCEGLSVKVHLTGADSAAELPTLEYSYETPAAVVLQRKGPWFKIRLAEQSGWIRATAQNQFFSLEELLAENLTYVANADGGGLAAAPGTERSAATNLLSAERHVKVLENRAVGEQLWLRVAVQSHSVCEGVEEPTTLAEGWVPAHSATGEPTVWFYSRGC